MNDTKISVTLGLLNAILGYLGTRPYQESAQLIQGIQEQAGPQVPMPESMEKARIEKQAAERHQNQRDTRLAERHSWLHGNSSLPQGIQAQAGPQVPMPESIQAEKVVQ